MVSTLRWLIVVWASSLLLSQGVAVAATRYVSDDFKITVRRGESSEHKVIKMLASGTPVEVLSTNEDTGYSQIRTQDGVTGYVLSRYLMETPAARERLAAVEQRLAELQQEPDKLGGQLAALQQRHAALQSEFEQTRQTNEHLELELAQIRRTAADAVSISEERDQLLKQVNTLNRQLEDVKLENQGLRDHSDKKWFISGAGVLAAGIALGLIIPRLRSRRRRDMWGSGSISLP